MARIRIKNLLIRTYIGFNPDELVNKQDVIINLEIETDIPESAMDADEPDGIFDYKTITKKVIALVQEGRFKLLEVWNRFAVVFKINLQYIPSTLFNWTDFYAQSYELLHFLDRSFVVMLSE